MNSNIHMLLIHRNHTIRNDQRISIAQLTIISQQVVLRLLIVRLNKLMLFKPVTHSPPLMNSSQHTLTDERPLELSVLNDRITLHPYLTYDNLAILPNIDRHNHLVRRSRIILLQDLNLSILVSLLIEIPLSQNLRTVDHIRRQLIVLDQPQLRLQILPITLLHPSITYLRDTRARHEFDTQISRIINNRIHPHRHVRKQAILPIPLDSPRNLSSRHRYTVPHADTRQTHQHLLVKIRQALHRDTFDHNLTWRTTIVHRHRRITSHPLSPRRQHLPPQSQHHHTHYNIILISAHQ